MPARDPQDGYPDPLRRALRAGEGGPERHLDPEELLALRDGSLADDVAAGLREHLSQCGDCATELLELEALFAGIAGDLPAAELDASWQRQRGRLPAPKKPAQRDRPRLRFLESAWGFGVAASILAVVVVGQWQRIEELERPRVNPPLIQLVPAGAVRQANPDLVGRIEWKADEPRIWLILNPRVDLDRPPYTIEIVDPRGRVVDRLDGVAPTEAGNVHLELARESLVVGRHRILIFDAGRPEATAAARAASKPQPIESFAVDVGGPPR